MDPAKIVEMKQQHEAYLSAFIDNLATMAIERNKNVIGIKSKGVGSAYEFPTMKYFAKEKKS